MGNYHLALSCKSSWSSRTPTAVFPVKQKTAVQNNFHTAVTIICKAGIRNPLCDLSSDSLQRLIHTSGAVPAQVECYIRKSKLFQIIVYLCPAGFLHEFAEF